MQGTCPAPETLQSGRPMKSGGRSAAREGLSASQRRLRPTSCLGPTRRTCCGPLGGVGAQPFCLAGVALQLGQAQQEVLAAVLVKRAPQRAVAARAWEGGDRAGVGCPWQQAGWPGKAWLAGRQEGLGRSFGRRQGLHSAGVPGRGAHPRLQPRRHPPAIYSTCTSTACWQRPQVRGCCPPGAPWGSSSVRGRGMRTPKTLQRVDAL